MAVVLIVEDDLPILFVAEYALHADGHETIAAASRKQAIDVLKSRDDVDVLVTDVNLRGDKRAGIDLADAAVKLKPELGVVYATASGPDLPRVAHSAFVSKPYSSSQLTTAVKHVLRAA
jgi:CheY-like chemotaxis protein